MSQARNPYGDGHTRQPRITNALLMSDGVLDRPLLPVAAFPPDPGLC